MLLVKECVRRNTQLKNDLIVIQQQKDLDQLKEVLILKKEEYKKLNSSLAKAYEEILFSVTEKSFIPEQKP